MKTRICLIHTNQENVSAFLTDVARRAKCRGVIHLSTLEDCWGYNGEIPHLILLDLHAEIEGPVDIPWSLSDDAPALSLIREMRARYPRANMVAITHTKCIDDGTKALNAGANQFQNLEFKNVDVAISALLTAIHSPIKEHLPVL